MSDEMTTMSPKKSIRDLKSEYSPNINPLVAGSEIKTKSKRVRVGMTDTISTETGEVISSVGIMGVEEKAPEHFVKVFADGVAASYDLKPAARRVFLAILREYELMPLTGGYVDSINLPWFGAGLCGNDIGMSKRTFNRGFADLLEKRFISPKTHETYWVNPNLFFKGDRVRFIKEYRRVRSEDAAINGSRV
jgi:hypothetical protein